MEEDTFVLEQLSQTMRGEGRPGEYENGCLSFALSKPPSSSSYVHPLSP